jgi:hypothetical protein
MSTIRGLRALIAVGAACLATAVPALAQEESLSNDRAEGLGLASNPQPSVLETLQLPTGGLGLGPISPISPASGLPALQDDAVFCCDSRHFWPAIGEIGILMVVPWYFNRHVSDDSTAVVTFDTWKRNVVQGFEWDRDNFKTNMWAHPFHGATFFNSARSNGYDFWQSAAFSFTGSFLGEMFGEANRPAINDWMSTSIGGIGLGETTHRFSLMIWDNTATGFGRTMREFAGLLVNPMGGFSRLVRGEWTKVGANPEDRFPSTSAGALRLGYRNVGDGGRAQPSQGGFFSFDYGYGNAFTDFGKPFDVFEFTAQVYGDNEEQHLGLAHLTASLYGTELKNTEKSDHVFHLAQHFDYVNIETLETGGSSLSATFLSRWELSESWNLHLRLEPSALLIWGLNSEYSDFTQRDYDFGSGAGLRSHLIMRNRSGANVQLSYLLFWQHTLNGAVGDHILQLGGIRGFVPVYKKLGLGATWFLNVRDSYYRDYPDVFRRNPEFRVFAAWSFE